MRRNRRITAAAAAFFMAFAAPVTGYAAVKPMVGNEADQPDGGGNGPAQWDGSVPEPEEVISREELEDNRLEYREVGSRVENYNSTYRQAKTSIVDAALSLDAARELGKEANEMMEDALDLKDDEMDAETRALYEGYKETAQELRRQAQKLTNADLPAAQERTLRQAKNKLTKTVQGLMIQYQALLPQAEAAQKAAELAEAQVDSSKRMMELGMSSQEDVLTAQKALYEAQANARKAADGAETLRQNILVLLGWDFDAPVEFVPLGEPDLTKVAAMNLEQDKERAIASNYELRDTRSGSASGAAARSIKKRSTSVTMQSVSLQMEQLYASVQAKKQAYDAAVSEFAAAEQTMAAADRQHALGMIGKIQYLGQQAAYLGAKASRESASMELFRAIEDYDWAARGLLVSNGG